MGQGVANVCVCDEQSQFLLISIIVSDLSQLVFQSKANLPPAATAPVKRISKQSQLDRLAEWTRLVRSFDPEIPHRIGAEALFVESGVGNTRLGRRSSFVIGESAEC